jgi:hypothetical protein
MAAFWLENEILCVPMVDALPDGVATFLKALSTLSNGYQAEVMKAAPLVV